MKLTSEQKKLIYQACEGSDELKALVEPLKEDLVTAGRVHTELEEANDKLKQFEGLDLADLKSKAKFVEDRGGEDKIIDSFAKSEGYETDISRVEKEKKAVADEKEAEVVKNQALSKELETTKIVNRVMGDWNKNMIDTADCAQLHAAVKNGVFFLDGETLKATADGVTKDYSDNGIALVMESSNYKGLKKSPSGSDDPLNTPNKEQNGGGSEIWWNPNNN